MTTLSFAIQKEVDFMTAKYDAIILGTGQSDPSLNGGAFTGIYVYSPDNDAYWELELGARPSLRQ